MGTYTGTSTPDTITPTTVSAGVNAVPAGSRPSGAADILKGLGGGDNLDGGGGNDTIYGGPNASADVHWIQWKPEDGGNGHWYAIDQQGMTWPAAEAAAEALGGHLATISSEAENSFAYDLAAAAGRYQEIWLGGFQPQGSAEPDGGWQWVTGEPFDYTNWAGGQPDDSGGLQDGLQFWFGPEWDDKETYSDYLWSVIESPSLPSVMDILHGGAGDDLIYGGRRVEGNAADEDTADGPDRIYGDTGNDTVWAGAGDDTLYGGAGNDRLNGQSGTDKLYGQAGIDTLSGGLGRDLLNGGLGNDVYDFDATRESRPGANTRDIILAFDGIGRGEGDRIDLSTIDANTALPGNQAFAFRTVVQTITGPGEIHVIPHGADSLIQANVGGSLAPELEILVRDGAALPVQWVAGDFIL